MKFFNPKRRFLPAYSLGTISAIIFIILMLLINKLFPGTPQPAEKKIQKNPPKVYEGTTFMPKESYDD